MQLSLEGRSKQNWGCVDTDRDVGVLFWADKLGGASHVCGQVWEPYLEAGLGLQSVTCACPPPSFVNSAVTRLLRKMTTNSESCLIYVSFLGGAGDVETCSTQHYQPLPSFHEQEFYLRQHRWL